MMRMVGEIKGKHLAGIPEGGASSSRPVRLSMPAFDPRYVTVPFLVMHDLWQHLADGCFVDSEHA